MVEVVFDFLREYIRDAEPKIEENEYGNNVIFDYSVCEDLRVPSRYNMSFDYYSWRKAYEMCDGESIYDLLREVEDEKVKNGLRAYLYYYDTESDFYIDDVFIIVDKGGSGTKNSIRRGIKQVFDRIDPVYAALLSAWISRIEIKNIGCGGRYGRNNKKILIDTRMTNTVCHEVGHALQDLMGVFGIWMKDNREAPEWLRFNMLEKNPIVNKNDIQKNFKKRFSQIWDEYDMEVDNSVRSYQNKNINEFFTVGFERWVTNRKHLMKVQPGLCELFDDYFSGFEEGESYFGAP